MLFIPGCTASLSIVVLTMPVAKKESHTSLYNKMITAAKQTSLTKKQLADDRLQQDQSRQQIQAALNKLPKRMRIIMLLKEWEEFSYEEIAEIMNCSRGTVKSRIFRAREKLRPMLKNVQMP